MKGISIGDLDQRVTIRSGTDTRNSMGERVISWANALECWADVQIVKAEERDIAGSDRNVITHNVIIRYSTVPQEDNLIIWNGTTLEIKKIQPLDKYQEWMMLECSTCLT